MLERLREQSLKEPEPELIEEERENPLKRFTPSALGLSPRQTFVLAVLFLLDVLFFSCICLVAASKLCPPFLSC